MCSRLNATNGPGRNDTGFAPWRVRLHRDRSHELILNFLLILSSPVTFSGLKNEKWICFVWFCFIVRTMLSFFLGKRKINFNHLIASWVSRWGRTRHGAKPAATPGRIPSQKWRTCWSYPFRRQNLFGWSASERLQSELWRLGIEPKTVDRNNGLF